MPGATSNNDVWSTIGVRDDASSAVREITRSVSGLLDTFRGLSRLVTPTIEIDDTDVKTAQRAVDSLEQDLASVDVAPVIDIDDTDVKSAQMAVDRLEADLSSVGNPVVDIDDTDVKSARKTVNNLKKDIISADAKDIIVDVDTADIASANASIRSMGTNYKDVAGGIQKAENEQEDLNKDIKSGADAAGGLAGKIMGVVGAYVGFQAIKDSAVDLVNMNTQFTGTMSRLELMNDGLQTTDELNKMIRQSALDSFSSYEDVSAAVSKMGLMAGNAFDSSAEIVRFSEILNKMFKIAGTSTEGKASAMLQLTQAMSAGVLRGEELNAILENAPMLARSIESHMGWAEGSIKQYAMEGLVTADIVKQALFESGEEIDKMFENMDMTWADIWENFKTKGTESLEPVMKKMTELFNSERFLGAMDGLSRMAAAAASALEPVIDGVTAVFNFIYDNWTWLKPIFIGLAVALGVVVIGILGYAAAAAIAAIATMSWLWPILLVAAAIGIGIALFYYMIEVINRLLGTSVSATGIIAGLFSGLFASIYNVLVYTWNMVAAFVEYFINVWKHPVYSAKKLFYNLVSTVIDYIISMAGMWVKMADVALSMAVKIVGGFDKAATKMANAVRKGINKVIEGFNWLVSKSNDILGTDFGTFELIAETDSVKSSLEGIKEDLSTETIVNPLKDAKNALNDRVGPEPDDYVYVERLEFKDVGKSFDSGYKRGSGFDGLPSTIEEAVSLEDLTAGVTPSSLGAGKSSPGSSSGGSGNGANKELKNIGKGVDKVADNTGKISDNTAGSKNYDYLREFAVRETINRTVSVNLDIHPNVTFTHESGMDVDGVIRKMTDMMVEELSSAANKTF